MALELDNEVGGASANCYNTLQQFNDYLAGVFPKPTTALNASEDNKNRAIAAACQQIDLREYDANKVTSTQARKFPRFGLRKPDSESYASSSEYITAAYYDQDEIPAPVKRAECVIAQALLEGTYRPNQVGGAGEVQAFQSDGVAFTYRKSANGRDASQWPQEATELLKPLFKQLRFVRS